MDFFGIFKSVEQKEKEAKCKTEFEKCKNKTDENSDENSDKNSDENSNKEPIEVKDQIRPVGGGRRKSKSNRRRKSKSSRRGRKSRRSRK